MSYEKNPYLFSKGTTLYVYTWEGEKVRQCKLDIPVSQIVVSEDDKTLYAIAYNPYPEVVRFDLSGSSTIPFKRNETVHQHGIIKEGEYLIDADLYDLEGNIHHLADYKGKYLLLDFWRLNCGPCQYALPELREISSRYKGSLTVISISHDVQKVWQKASEEKNITWENLNDLKGMKGIFMQYGVYGVPHFVLISPKGKILKKWDGYSKGSIKKKLEELLDK